MNLEAVADALLNQSEPIVVLIDGDGFTLGCPLGGDHPATILDALRAQGEGPKWHAVGLLISGEARHLNTGEIVGRILMSLAMSRYGGACRMLSPDGVSNTVPAEGALVDAIRAFLA